MKALTSIVAGGIVFGVLPLTTRLSSVAAATLLVALGVLLALAASATPSALAVAAGALGAYGGGVLLDAAPALAGAALVGLCFAERSVRVRERNARIVHVVLALAGGALAGYVSTRYALAEPMVRAVVIVIAAVLASAPLLVPADDPIAFALDDIARDLDGTVADDLRAGADLRRSVDESLLDPDSAKSARRAWKSLLSLARARARLSRTPGGAYKTPWSAASTSASTPTWTASLACTWRRTPRMLLP